MPKFYKVDGAELKNITLPQYPDEAWDWISGAPKTDNDELYAKVSAVFRAANMTAEAVANMPFVLKTEGGADYDDSRDWQNKVGFINRPRELLRLFRLSLFMTNKAYGFMEGNKVDRNLRYLVPSTIEPVVDKTEGIVGFKRSVNNQTTLYPIEEGRIFWMYHLDHTTELLPSEYSEFHACMAAAGVLYFSDYFIQRFFARGGVDPAMLMVKGVPDPTTRDKIENAWSNLMSNAYKYLGRIFNAEAMEVHKLGNGAEALRDSQLHQDKLADIALAAGIPLSLLVANSANYATADIEYRTWFRDKVIPDVHFIEDEMNDKLFRPLGLHLEFTPEVTNTGTQEEKERAGAFSALVASNILPSKAAEILGYDLPEGVEFTDLDKDYFMLLEKKAEAGQTDMPQIAEPKPPRDKVPPDVEVTPKSVTLLTIDQLRELELWQSFAFRKLKRDESLDFPFVCKQLPEEVASKIRSQLPRCRSTEDIERVYQMTARDTDPIKELAEALNKAVDNLKPEGLEVQND